MEEIFEYDEQYDEEYFYFHKKKKKSSFRDPDWYDANIDRFLEEEDLAP
jgi:hypothetical protein